MQFNPELHTKKWSLPDFSPELELEKQISIWTHFWREIEASSLLVLVLQH
jgi:hypothetical protein